MLLAATAMTPSTEQPHNGPVTIRHRVNTPAGIRRALRPRLDGGLETDVRFDAKGPVVAHDAGARSVPLQTCVEVALDAAAGRYDRPAWLIELKEGPRDATQAEAFRELLLRTAAVCEVRLVSFRSDVLQPFLDDPVVPAFVFVQQDARPGRSAWRDLDEDTLHPRLGLHVRLHRFDRRSRPTLDEVERLGRPFQVSAWTPWTRGWPRARMKGIWNVWGLR